MAKYSGELFDAPPAVADSAPPPAVAEAPAPAASEADVSTQFGNEFEREKARIKAAQVQSAEQMQTDTPLLDSALFGSPPALIAGGAAAAAAALYTANAIKNRYLSSSPQNNLSSFQNYLDTRIEPPFENQSNVLNLDDIKARMAGVTPEPVLSDSLLPRAAPVFTDPVLGTPEIDRNIPAYQRQGITFAGTTPIGQPAAPLAPTPLAPAMAPVAAPAPVAPVTYVQPGQSFADVTPVNVAPETTPITSSAGPNSTTTQAVTGLLTEEIKAAGVPETKVAGASVPETTVTQPVPPPAYNQRVQNAMEGVPQSVKDQYAKEGKVVLKGYGVGDRSLTNTYGPEAYAKIIDYFNNGQPIGSDANYQAVQKKINKGIPSSLAAEFATKLPGSEAEAGNFGKSFGDVGAYTPEGKVVTSPAAMKNAVAKGGAIFLAASIPNALLAAQQGNYGKLAELGFDIGTSAIPGVGTALTALTGTSAGAPTLRSDPYAEVLNRPGVRQTLQSMSQTMSPSQFNVARDQYLSKISQFPEINTARVTKPIIGSSRPLNPNTLLPVPPPR